MCVHACVRLCVFICTCMIVRMHVCLFVYNLCMCIQASRVQDSLFHLQTPYMFLGRSLYDSLVLKDDISSVKVAT